MLLTVARIGTAHGLAGEVRLNIRTDNPEKRFIAGAVLDTKPAEVGPLTVERVRNSNNRFIVKFAESCDRNVAESLQGVELVIDSADTNVEEDTYYAFQLRGLSVVDSSGNSLGTITELRLGSAQDLLEIETSGGSVLVPFVKQMVPEVDLEAGTVVVTPPPGLFPSEEAGN